MEKHGDAWSSMEMLQETARKGHGYTCRAHSLYGCLYNINRHKSPKVDMELYICDHKLQAKPQGRHGAVWKTMENNEIQWYTELQAMPQGRHGAV